VNHKVSYLKKSINFISLFIFYFQFQLFSDFVSTQGRVGFDANNDGQNEMVLNTTGLQIGGEVSTQSNLHVQGSIGFSVQTVTTTSNINKDSFVLADSSASNVMLILPSANISSGRTVHIKKNTSENSVWVVAEDKIDDYHSNFELKEGLGMYAYMSLFSDGEQWYVYNESSVNYTVASDNLFAWWQLDETSGTTVNNSIRENYMGALTGGFTFDSDSTAGLSDNGLQFDSGDVIDLGDAIIDDATVLSISLWVKVNDLSSDHHFVIKGSGSTAAIILWRDETASSSGRTDTFSAFVNNTIRVEASSNSSSDTDWHHLVMTYKGNDVNGLRLYIDGVEDANSGTSTVALSQLKNDANDLKIGGGTTDGVIDDVRMYDRELTPDEVYAIFIGLVD